MKRVERGMSVMLLLREDKTRSEATNNKTQTKQIDEMEREEIILIYALNKMIELIK